MAFHTNQTIIPATTSETIAVARAFFCPASRTDFGIVRAAPQFGHLYAVAPRGTAVVT
jgi:hypothetical protein